MATYNGHNSWNACNVSLWINNDEILYNRAVYYAKKNGIAVGARLLFKELEGQKTPDGARYNLSSVRAAMRGII